jgi:hypothetical protein
MDPRTSITQSYLARALGISSPMVTRLKAKGMPVDCVEAAQAWRQAHLSVARVVGQRVKPQKAPSDEGGTFLTWRTRREKASAQTAEMELLLRCGELVEAARVRDAMARHLGAAKSIALGFAPRLAPVLSVKTDIAEIANLLDVEVMRMLHEMARMADPFKRNEDDEHGHD